MKKLSFCLHCGGSEVDYQQVIDTRTPAPTETHFPIAHDKVVREVVSGLRNDGWVVDRDAHALSHEGQRYFGLFQVHRNVECDVRAYSKGDVIDVPEIRPEEESPVPAVIPQEEQAHSLVIGVRNSHDQSFSMGLVAGRGVFVCDNLSFSGEARADRKHTRFIERDLPQVAGILIARLYHANEVQEKRIAAYQESGLTDREANDLIVKAYRARCLPSSKIGKVVDQWHDPAHPEWRERTAWSLFNGFTEVSKGIQLAALSKRTQTLHGVFDRHLGLSFKRQDVPAEWTAA